MSTPNVDYGSRHKFFASIGLLFMAASAVPLWGTFQRIEILLVPVRELDSLTAEARSAVTQQQDYASAYLQNAVLIAVILLLVGLVSFLYGVTRWRARQAVVDQIEDNQLKATFEPQSSEERSQGTQSKLRNDKARAPSLEGWRYSGVGSASPTRDAPPSGKDADAVETMQADDYAMVESRVVDLIERALGATHVTESNIRLDIEGGSSYYLDAIATAREKDGRSYVFEIRIVQNLSLTQAKGTIFQVSQEAKAIERVLGRSHTGVAFFVTSNDTDDREQRLYREMRELTATMESPVVAVVINEIALWASSARAIRALIERKPAPRA